MLKCSHAHNCKSFVFLLQWESESLSLSKRHLTQAVNLQKHKPFNCNIAYKMMQRCTVGGGCWRLLIRAVTWFGVEKATIQTCHCPRICQIMFYMLRSWDLLGLLDLICIRCEGCDPSQLIWPKVWFKNTFSSIWCH